LRLANSFAATISTVTPTLLAAINALNLETRERLDNVVARLDAVDAKFDVVAARLGAKIDDTNARVRSIEESIAEVKDLLVEALGRG
jgi:hypothetical protein